MACCVVFPQEEPGLDSCLNLNYYCICVALVSSGFCCFPLNGHKNCVYYKSLRVAYSHFVIENA